MTSRLIARSTGGYDVTFVGYPFLIEPAIGTKQQALAWSIGFGAFAVLMARKRVARIEGS